MVSPPTFWHLPFINVPSLKNYISANNICYLFHKMYLSFIIKVSSTTSAKCDHSHGVVRYRSCNFLLERASSLTRKHTNKQTLSLCIPYLFTHFQIVWNYVIVCYIDRGFLTGPDITLGVWSQSYCINTRTKLGTEKNEYKKKSFLKAAQQHEQNQHHWSQGPLLQDC